MIQNSKITAKYQQHFTICSNLMWTGGYKNNNYFIIYKQAMMVQIGVCAGKLCCKCEGQNGNLILKCAERGYVGKNALTILCIIIEPAILVTVAIIANHAVHCVITTGEIEVEGGNFMTPYCQQYFITHSFMGVIKILFLLFGGGDNIG